MRTLGENERAWEEETDKLFGEGDASSFRVLAVRADIQYSTKEICRGMAQPTVCGPLEEVELSIDLLFLCQEAAYFDVFQLADAVLCHCFQCQQTGRALQLCEPRDSRGGLTLHWQSSLWHVQAQCSRQWRSVKTCSRRSMEGFFCSSV